MSEPEFDYSIKFVVSATNDEEALDKFHDMMMGKSDYITPDVEIIKDEYSESYFGDIKPEGTI